MVPEMLGLSLLSFVVKGVFLWVGYITNNAFPQPLKEEEEAYYLGLLQKGDETARNILTERNLRLVAHIVKMFYTMFQNAVFGRHFLMGIKV